MNRNTAHIWGQDGAVKATIELPIPPPAVSRADGTQKSTAHLSPELTDLKVDKKVSTTVSSRKFAGNNTWYV
jgi:hypothetical protein